MKHIEILIPCYNEQECVKLFYNKVEEVFKNSEILGRYEHSYLYIDDGSSDDTLNMMRSLAESTPKGRVKYVSFSRNFGKEAALNVGFEKCTGDYVVPMDADLQHPPELLEKMIMAVEEGYDCAAARRVSRKGEDRVRSILSNGYYRLMNAMLSINMVSGSTDYRMMTRQVVRAILSLDERERFTKGIYSWVGFKTKWIEYENVERAVGSTKWSIVGLFNYAVNSFVSFATTPLRAVIYLGVITVIIAAVWLVTLLYGAIFKGQAGSGFVTIMATMLALGGIIITILGVIGEYMARIYLEVKHRPLYIIKEDNFNNVDRIYTDALHEGNSIGGLQ